MLWEVLASLRGCVEVLIGLGGCVRRCQGVLVCVEGCLIRVSSVYGSLHLIQDYTLRLTRITNRGIAALTPV